MHSLSLGKPKPVKKGKKQKKTVKKVSSRGALIKRAHSLMRDIVMLRDGGCVCPPPKNGHSAVRQAGHIIRSVKGGSRFSLWNVHEQCKNCNGRHVRDWEVYQEWFIRKFGNERWLLLLEEKRNDGLKNHEIEDISVQLQAIKEKQLLETELGKEFKPYYTQKEILSGAWKIKNEWSIG